MNKEIKINSINKLELKMLLSDLDNLKLSIKRLLADKKDGLGDSPIQELADRVLGGLVGIERMGKRDV